MRAVLARLWRDVAEAITTDDPEVLLRRLHRRLRRLLAENEALRARLAQLQRRA